MDFKPGVVTPAEFLDRKGQCTSRQLSLLVASAEFRKHQFNSKPYARHNIGAVSLVSTALLVMGAILLAEGLRPRGPLSLEPRVRSCLRGYPEPSLSCRTCACKGVFLVVVTTTGCEFGTLGALPVGNSAHDKLSCRS